MGGEPPAGRVRGREATARAGSRPAPLSEAELSVLNLAADTVSEAELTSPAVGACRDCVLADFAEAETEQLGDLVCVRD